MSSLAEWCPLFRVSIKERFNCINLFQGSSLRILASCHTCEPYKLHYDAETLSVNPTALVYTATDTKGGQVCMRRN